MELITVNASNIAQEHICCSISEKKGESCVANRKLIKITSKEQAQQAPSPFTTYSLFHNGNFVTNEILSPTKFQKMIRGLKG